MIDRWYGLFVLSLFCVSVDGWLPPIVCGCRRAVRLLGGFCRQLHVFPSSYSHGHFRGLRSAWDHRVPSGSRERGLGV